MTSAGITLLDWVFEVKRHLLSGTREETNNLAGSINTTQTTLSLDQALKLGAVTPGAVIEIDSELMIVRTADDGTKAVTVRRAQLGSVAAAHNDDTIVNVNPRFTQMAVIKALTMALHDLGSTNFYAVGTVDLTYVPGVFGYDLGTSVNEILMVRAPLQGISNLWPEIDNYALDNNADLASFPSGTALYLYELPLINNDPIQVTYRADFAVPTLLTDDVSLTGLPNTAYDLPPIGAALQLMAGRPIKRNFTESQGDTRRASEVPPGAVDNSITQLQRHYQRRISSEVASLVNRFPRQRKMYGTRSNRWALR